MNNFYETPLYLIIGNKDLKSFLIYFNLLRLGYQALYLEDQKDDYNKNLLKGILNIYRSPHETISLITVSENKAHEIIFQLLDEYSKTEPFFHFNKDKIKQLQFNEVSIKDIFEKAETFNILESRKLWYINEFLLPKMKMNYT